MRASELATLNQIQVVGIMSGTSVDGVDFVLARVSRKSEGLRIQFVGQAAVKFPSALREKILEAVSHKLKVDALAELHYELGRFYAKKLQEVGQKKNWKFDLVGLHGQTVYHRGKATTLQIGEPSFLSALLNVPVVADFRSADIALGGQGAPLAPFFHRVALASEKSVFAIHNLGGISNLTLIKDGRILCAFDTGPANMPIDLAIQAVTKGKKSFDSNGSLARQGKVQDDFVKAALQHSYFKKKAPKSCGREEFGAEWLKDIRKKFRKLSGADLVASVTELVAQSIAHSYATQVPETPAEIVLCGGGSKNLFLKERLQALMPKSLILTTDDRGWSPQAVEGGAFALLAATRIWDLPVDLRTSTGASHAGLYGKVTDVSPSETV